MGNKNTIIVNSCDAYEDIWQLFFCAFEEHWSACPYKIVINTESKKFNLPYKNVNSHSSSLVGKADKWGLRLKETLKSCDSEYVIMLYDDFVLEGKVNQKAIEQCIEWLDNHQDVTVFYFTHNSANVNTDDDRFECFEAIPQRGDYKLNSAPALWRRDKLLGYIEDDDTPWAWEYFGSYRAYKSNEKFYSVKRDCENIYPYNYSMGGAIYRGKWVGKVVTPLIEKYNLKLDISLRGLADGEKQNNKRTIKWKISFILLGFRMIGFGTFLFIYRIIKIKALKYLHV